MCTGFTIRVVLIMAIITPSVAGAESPEVMLERGLFEEKTKGDLDAAIAVYEQMIAVSQANRKHVAAAHFRRVVGYENKQAYDKVEIAFTNVIHHFADQKEVAAQAAQRCAALRCKLPEEHVAKVVKQVVEAVSTMDENAARLKDTLGKLDDLNEQLLVKHVSGCFERERQRNASRRNPCAVASSNRED